MPGAEYETGNLTLALMEPEAFGGEFAKSGTAVALRVDDVAARREELEAKGVTFFGDTIDSGVCSRRSSPTRTAIRSSCTTGTRRRAEGRGRGFRR